MGKANRIRCDSVSKDEARDILVDLVENGAFQFRCDQCDKYTVILPSFLTEHDILHTYHALVLARDIHTEKYHNK